MCRSRPKPNHPQSWPQAHLTTGAPSASNGNWVLDSGATHHIASDLHNLSMHSNYVGNEDVVVGDGTGIPISHTGSFTLTAPNTTFTLNNILCAPSIKQNLISVS